MQLQAEKAKEWEGMLKDLYLLILIMANYLCQNSTNTMAFVLTTHWMRTKKIRAGAIRALCSHLDHMHLLSASVKLSKRRVHGAGDLMKFFFSQYKLISNY